MHVIIIIAYSVIINFFNVDIVNVRSEVNIMSIVNRISEENLNSNGLCRGYSIPL